eukprot:2613786-Lingulodinium_polyedra.AAC.1
MSPTQPTSGLSNPGWPGARRHLSGCEANDAVRITRLIDDNASSFGSCLPSSRYVAWSATMSFRVFWVTCLK